MGKLFIIIFNNNSDEDNNNNLNSCLVILQLFIFKNYFHFPD